MPDENDFLVAFDKPTSQITVANIKSRMSLAEAAELATDLTAVVEANTPKPV